MKWYRLAAEQGDADAQYAVGDGYQYGKGVTQDHKEAMKWYKLVIENKYTNSSTLSSLSWNLYVMNEYKHSLKVNKKAIELGNKLAINNMGEYYEHGVMVKRNFQKAFDYYAKAASYGEENGYYNLARHHFLGLNNNANYKQALRLAENSILINESENPDSPESFRIYRDLRYMIKKNKKIFKNYDDSFPYLKLLASDGNVLASLFLAHYYEYKEKYIEALKWYTVVLFYEEYSKKNSDNVFYSNGVSEAGVERIKNLLDQDAINNISNKVDGLFKEWLIKVLKYEKNNQYINKIDAKITTNIKEEYKAKKAFLKKIEHDYWMRIDMQDIEQIKLYKVKYPNGEYKKEAELKIKRLEEISKFAKKHYEKKITLGNYHALIIGNNNYQNLTKLKNAINDARAVAKLLENKFNFNIRTIENASRNQILSAIYELRKIDKNDNIIIYYSGHGFKDLNAETSYWQPIDAEENKPFTWIHESELKSELKAINAKHVMVVADSCFSGAILRGVEEIDTKTISKEIMISRNLKKRIRVAFTSGGEEPVLDGGGGKHSIFAKSFLEVLNNINEPVEGRYIFKKVSEKLAFNAKQQPQYDPILNAGGERGGDFVFIPKVD